MTFITPWQLTDFSLIVASMGAQHEQLEANPILWLKGFADDKQLPLQPEVGILNVHPSLFIWMKPPRTWQSEVGLGQYCLLFCLAVTMKINKIPTTTLETETNIFKTPVGIETVLN